ncbi:MAG: hypothetical protein IKO11_01145 [Lachnospiraceae bacterium]|nr:hypothetical protein [Lachnospiraceae bacterium]
MDVKCDYCAGYFDDTLTECPHCGAANNHIRRMSEGIPKTIEELKQYCTDHKVPVQQMHFHIGEDYKGAKAFGIYRNGDQIVVYKNKADGSRAVRYSGRDEAYAVNEIYQKMRTEYNAAKEANTPRSGGPNVGRTTRSQGVHKPNVVNSLPEGHFKSAEERKKRLRIRKIRRIVITAVIIFAVICIFAAYSGGNHNGYYNYKDNYYYNQHGSWYLYDKLTNGWITTERPSDDINDYYESSYYSSDYGIDDFSSSDYYEESSYSSSYYDDDDDDDSWSSSWDDDDDWDSGSDWDWDSGSDWDSGWTDWDSDW